MVLSTERTPTTALVTLFARLQLMSGVLGLISMASEYISPISWSCRCRAYPVDPARRHSNIACQRAIKLRIIDIR